MLLRVETWPGKPVNAGSKYNLEVAPLKESPLVTISNSGHERVFL